MESNPESFTEVDEKSFIEALNFIAVEATFGKEAPNVAYSIKVRNHFAFLQSLVPKIHSHIREIKALHKPDIKKKSKANAKAAGDKK